VRANPPKPLVHGASEIWERPDLARKIEKDRERLAQRLRAFRLARGLSQEKAAELAGIHPIHLTRIEGSAINITLATLSALAAAYGIPLGELFSDSLVPPQVPNPRSKPISARRRSAASRVAHKARK